MRADCPPNCKVCWKASRSERPLQCSLGQGQWTWLLKQAPTPSLAGRWAGREDDARALQLAVRERWLPILPCCPSSQHQSSPEAEQVAGLP